MHAMSSGRSLRRPALARGVSLIEALVALAVMSIGMLALVGVQLQMRLNSDIAKQRTEATRIASEEIERLRNFISIPAIAAQPGVSYAEIVARQVAAYQPPDGIGNTTYRIDRNVWDAPDGKQKIISVRVSWLDRSRNDDTEMSVTLDSAISATQPTLGGMLVVPYRESATSRKRGRHVSIPDGAVDLGDGYSRFTPPGSTAVAWIFNNTTGVLRVCPDTETDYAVCPLATLVSGTVAYSVGASQPTGANAEHPEGLSFNLAGSGGALTLDDVTGNIVSTACYAVDYTAAELAAGVAVPYFCAVITTDQLGWGGQMNPRPVDSAGTSLIVPATQAAMDTALANGVAAYRVCRYTSDLPMPNDDASTPGNQQDVHAEFTLNAEHPRVYCMERPRNADEAALACTGNRVRSNLIHQNFLVIQGAYDCPTEASSPGTDSLVFANTRTHLPVP